MCGPFPAEVPVNTTQTTQITNGLFGIPTPISVYGTLNVSNSDAIYISSNADTVSSITNTGSITAHTTGYYGINNKGSITTLINSQGGDNSTPAKTALTYTGNLPSNYSIIINSPTSYGQLALTNPTGTSFNFGIDSRSVVTAGTYSDVLQGLSTINNVTGATGTFASGAYTYTYSLQYDASMPAANNWNLVVTAGGVAPEINASQLPQVALVISCLFLLFGRRNEHANKQEELKITA